MSDELARETPLPDPGMAAEGGTTEGALQGAADGNFEVKAGAPPGEQNDLTNPATPPPE